MVNKDIYSKLNNLKEKRSIIFRRESALSYLSTIPFGIYGSSFILQNGEVNDIIVRYLMPLMVSLELIKQGVKDKINMDAIKLRIKELQLLYKLQYKDEKVILIGGNDSIGVPYTRDNVNVRSHFDVVRDFLYKSKINARTVEMYSMARYNTTESFEEYLRNNISLAQIKLNQRESIDLCRNQAIFQKVQLRSNMKEMYVPDEYDYSHNLTDEIRKGLPIVIYSCGTNDFLQELGGNLDELLNIQGLRKAVLMSDEIILNIMPRIERNINQILSLNPNSEIYVLGLFVPSRIEYIRNVLYEAIVLFNSLLQRLCSNYSSVHYIDNMNITKEEIAHLDFHPNMNGQSLIGSNIVSAIYDNSRVLEKNKK